MKKTIIALATIAAFATPAFAAATASSDETAYAFNLDVSDANTPDGAARIYADIRRQAVRVCSPLEANGMLNAATRECRSDVIEETVRAIDSPLVTAEWRDDIGADRYAGR